jgi:hypothetical protein
LTRALNPRIEERKRPFKARKTKRAEVGKAKAEAGKMSRQKPKTSREGRHAKKGGTHKKKGKKKRREGKTGNLTIIKGLKHPLHDKGKPEQTLSTKKPLNKRPPPLPCRTHSGTRRSVRHQSTEMVPPSKKVGPSRL